MPPPRNPDPRRPPTAPRDDTWSAFHAAIAEPFDDRIGLRDAATAHAILASSDEDHYHADPAPER